jgi:uncharacterized membrane protein
MRKLSLLSTLTLLLFVCACNSSDEKTKEELKEEIRAELKAEQDEEKNSERQTEGKDSATDNDKKGMKTVNAKFEMMVTNTAGTYYVFTDENGKTLKFFPMNGKTKGMDFAASLQSGDTNHKYSGKEYQITYDELWVEGKNEMENRLYIINAEPAATSGKSNDGSGKQAAFTAKEIKNAVFMGTEPFWDITFYDSYAERNDPSDRKATFYYMKDGTYAVHQLADVIEPASSNSVTFTIIDEAGMVPGVVTITRKACDDGMSDNIYPYTFSLQWENGNAWKGCGRIK